MENAFDDWFNEYSWWHENTAREGLQAAWGKLKAAGVSDETIESVFDKLRSVMKNEYGE